MILTVHARPRAKRAAFEWLDGDTAKVSVTEAPVGGKANAAIAKLIARELDIPVSRVELIRGATARIKQFTVPS